MADEKITSIELVQEIFLAIQSGEKVQINFGYRTVEVSGIEKTNPSSDDDLRMTPHWTITVQDIE